MKPAIPPDYASRIKLLRQRLGLTQTSFADMVGVSYASINRWENEQAKPSHIAWRKIERAEILGLQGLQDNHPQGVREPPVSYPTKPDETPDLDFSTSPEIVRTVVEGYRLAYGHQFNPTFATETSLIDPLPHQRIAVYEHMLPQPRLRFLLADDAGAGKTIMTGLYIREMLSRRLIQRVLIVPPAGLVGNWERELRTLFGLHFQILTGSDFRDGNPFLGPESHRLIISIDTLAGERAFNRLKEGSVTPYDLVIFDEAHKLSADREPDLYIRKTDRYRLAEALAGVHSEETGARSSNPQRWQLPWAAQHILLLTATPHMGKDFPFYCLWRLLEPEALSTLDAFNAYPPDARCRHFIRRTKEEMVRFDGTPIYPQRVSDTLSYDLTQGEVSEQALYDRATSYMAYYYNRARFLNRSAARLAMSVFQRRLASSTYALWRSLERREKKLQDLAEDIRSGKITPEQLVARQRDLDHGIQDILGETTADEESSETGYEQHEDSEDQALGAVVATSLAEIEAERLEVAGLRSMAQQVVELGHDSKFDKLVEVLHDPRFQNEKLIVFTEHRDTLNFLVRSLEGMGFTGQITHIDGSMDYLEREEARQAFLKPVAEGGVKYLIATDAAGEGINLQVGWLMVNYDIPWNPARLEQRMGRIHRYGQKHDPVFIVNLVAGKTREGRVLKTLLEKLERIRKELRSDKVFDVVGRLFEGVSLRLYLEQATSDEGLGQAISDLEGRLTAQQVRALEVRERVLFGDGGEVKRQVERLNADLERETYLRLLPGYVRSFFEHAAPLLNLGIDGNMESHFSLRPLVPGALDPFWPVLETYPQAQRNRFSFHRPDANTPIIFIHPGEPFFDHLQGLVSACFGPAAQVGSVFIDPSADHPYVIHLAEITVVRQADPSIDTFAQMEILETRLIGLREGIEGKIQPCPIESLLILRGGHGIPPESLDFAAAARSRLSIAESYIKNQRLQNLVEQHHQALLQDLSTRIEFLKQGFAFQEAELAGQRITLLQKANGGDLYARAELGRIKERQRRLAVQREAALKRLTREPELVQAGGITFLAHVLVVPSKDPEEIHQRDAAVEAIAMQVAIADEQAAGAIVKDVHTPELARAAGLGDYPGFDLLSTRPDSSERAIEVKGHANKGDIQISANEWSSACNHRDRYWLYTIYGCGASAPQLMKVQDPFSRLLAKLQGYILKEEDILRNSEISML